jgi:hydroxymethylbilane synthase
MNSAIIGTRGSPLALAQTEIIRGLLTKAHPQLRIEVKIIKTSGDQFNSLSLTAGLPADLSAVARAEAEASAKAGGGKGLFTKEIEDQLLRGEIHLAVHSMKDLPTTLPDGLTIGAVPQREDARDVLILKGRARPPGAPNHVGLDGGAPGGRALPELPEGARVATGSIRRRAQLLARRPDLQIEEIRGNVGTRLQKLADHEDLDAVILAAAGLKRLGLWQKSKQFRWQELDIDVMIPAVGQGIIACEVRESDLETQELLAPINHADTLACTEAERVFLRVLGGGCQVPYAAHATVNGQQMKLIGAKFSPDGKDFSKAEAIGTTSDPLELGERAAKQVLQ